LDPVEAEAVIHSRCLADNDKPKIVQVIITGQIPTGFKPTVNYIFNLPNGRQSQQQRTKQAKLDQFSFHYPFNWHFSFGFVANDQCGHFSNVALAPWICKLFCKGGKQS
jgi:hypothetical protein